MVTKTANFSTTLRRPILTLLCAFILFYLSQLFGLTLDWAQLLAFPVFALFVLSLSTATLTIPRKLVLIGLSLGVIASSVIHLYTPQQKKGVYVARLLDDKLEAESVMLRAKLNSFAELRNYAPALRFSSEIPSASELAGVFSSKLKSPIIWGDKTNLKLSNPPRSSQPLSALLLFGTEVKFPESIGRLRVVENVPAVSIPRTPEDNVVWFLGALVDAITPYPLANLDRFVSRSVVERLRVELNLRESARVRGWRKESHRALPLFYLGNYYLVESVSAKHFESGTLDCSIRAYRVALNYFDNDSANQELKAAIANNLLVASYLQDFFSGSKLDRRDLQNNFWGVYARSRRLEMIPGYEPVWVAAYENIEAISSLLRPGGRNKSVKNSSFAKLKNKKKNKKNKNLAKKGFKGKSKKQVGKLQRSPKHKKEQH